MSSQYMSYSTGLYLSPWVSFVTTLLNMLIKWNLAAGHLLPKSLCPTHLHVQATQKMLSREEMKVILTSY